MQRVAVGVHDPGPCRPPWLPLSLSQDLGDLWIEMLEDDCRPPWAARTVLHVINSHNSTFW